MDAIIGLIIALAVIGLILFFVGFYIVHQSKEEKSIIELLDKGYKFLDDVDKADYYFKQIPQKRDCSYETEERLSNAFINMGDKYLYGDGVEKDISKSIYYYEMSNCKKGLIRLGNLYLYGNGVDKNVSKALSFYHRAGGSEAWGRLGEIYMRGEGVDVNVEKALSYFEMIENGFNKPIGFKMSDIYLEIAEMYVSGSGVEENINKAIKYYIKAFNSGSFESALTLAKIYMQCRQKEEAIKWYEKAVSNGSAEAATELGVMYYFGDGVDLDPKKAIKLFKAAADAEDARAQYYLASCFEKAPDMERAIYWYKKSADNGYEAAKGKLSDLNS